MKNYLENNQSYIYNALLKYGYCNFSLIILEYCEPEKYLKREDFYLCSLPHEYNILDKAGSWLGHKHSDDAKKKISDSMVGNKNQPNSQQIEVTDIQNNTTTYYDSIRKAGRALNINESSIRKNIKSNINKPYKNLYMFAGLVL